MKCRIFCTLSYIPLVLLMIAGCGEISQNGKNGTNGKVTTCISWNYEYNDKGLPSKITSPGGKVTDLSYEFYRGIINNIKKIIKKDGDGIVSASFDTTGNLVEMQDNLGQVTYKYDQLNRPVKISRAHMPEISYSYNTSDQMTSLEISNGYRIDYTYDFLGRLTVMNTPAGEITYAYYAGDGIIERLLPNGIKTQYKYFADGKLEFITHAEKNGNVLVKYSYIYNPDGLIESTTEWSSQGERKLAYEYDKVQRLTGFIDADGSKTNYSYDEFGNRTEVSINTNTTGSYTYDGLGRMLACNEIPCEYDNAGNLLTDENGDKKFNYSSSNQLIKAGNTSYEFAGDGTLLARVNNNQKTTFITNPISDIWQPLVTTSEENNETCYIWEGDRPIAAIENGKANFFLSDHLGSVRELADENGNIVQQINYSPFGVPDQALSSNRMIPGFTGLFHEPEANLYITKARAYNPNSGRFLQIAPLHQIPSGTQKDLSLYAYCGGDPLNFIDRFGKQSNSLQEFEKIKREMYDLILYQYAFNYPNELDPGYLKCFQWQNRVFEKLEKMKATGNLNVWDFERIAEMNKTQTQYEHFFVVITNKETGKKYKIDPWRGGVLNSSFLADQQIGFDLLARKAGMPTKFHYDREKYEPNIMQSENPNIAKQEELRYLRSFFQNVNRNSYSTEQVYKFNTSNYNFKSNSLKIILEKPTPPYQSKFKRPDDDYPGLPPGRFDGTPGRIGDDWPPGGGGGGPSNVGGIYLNGSGKVFEGLGKLTGIAIDESNGKLVLISEEKGIIDLPPLRLDDVVTVFRSVYQYGEAPFVSIDPDPQNPKGPIMKSRHGEATANTYVGWILFEADRIMKAYSLGEDNISKKAVKSKVAGYDQVLDAMFSAETQGPIWERFWIVPSSVTRNCSSDQSLTLLDVPLMVKTQKMVMQNGKLVTAANGRSSKGAEEFSKWFTKNYDQIANESLSVPPTGSEMTEPVPVFKELQRIALVTAIAEQLRDQGIALPFWIRGYEVKPFPTPETTPTHTVTKDKGNAVYTVFGGVNLSPATDKIITKTASTLANSIIPKISEAVNNHTYLKPVRISVSEKNYQAAVIPGNDTKDLGPSVLNETDLSVPVKNNFYLNLTRKSNSFIAPLDKMFGKTWSLDLPFLEEQKIPVKKSGDDIKYRIAWNLISPMNSYSERIEDIYAGDDKLIGFKTRMIASSDGSNLHFNDKGFLVAYEQKPLMIIYNRDGENRITQIVGCYGQKVLADIKLEYNKERVVSANSSHGELIKYAYSDNGELEQVTFSKSGIAGRMANNNNIVSYEYVNGMITGIKYNGETERQFIYNEKGQLLGESSPGYPGIEYNITSDQFGTTVTTLTQVEDKKVKKSFLSRFELKKQEPKEVPQMELKEMVQYDHSFRPKKKLSVDGTNIIWDYSDAAYNKMQIFWQGSDNYQIKQSKDGRTLSYSLNDGIKYNEGYNEAGQLVSLLRNNQPVFQKKWNSFGKLDAIVYENSAVNNEYDADGVLKRTLVTPPGNSKTYKEWLEYAFDEDGNVSEVSDFTGMKTKYEYDVTGEIAAISSTQGNIKINRNKDQINSMETSWGNRINYVYDRKGNIKEINNSNSGKTSYLKFTEGLITEIAGSNGSKYSIDYYPEPQENLMKKIKTPVNTLEYFYSDLGDLQNVLFNNKFQITYSYDDSRMIKQILINSR